MMNNSLPLQTATFLNTRPRFQAQTLTSLLEELGANVIEMPMLEIIPVGDQKKMNKLLHHLPSSSIAIFLSANAVIPIADEWPKDQDHVTVCAMGPGTAKTLADHDIHVHAMPKEFNSEGLLKLPVLQDVKDKSIFIFCGENPKMLAPNTLKERGAHVTLIPCYRREKPTVKQTDYEALAASKIDLIISTSLAGLKNLYSIFGGARSDWLQQLPILVISPEMSEHLKNHQHPEAIIEANNASNEAIVEALIAWKHNRI